MSKVNKKGFGRVVKFIEGQAKKAPHNVWKHLQKQTTRGIQLKVFRKFGIVVDGRTIRGAIRRVGNNV